MGSWTTFIKGGVLCYSFVFMLIRSTGLTLVYFAHDSEVKKPNEYRNKRILNSSAVMKEVYGCMVYDNDENLWRSQLKHCYRIFPKNNQFSLYNIHFIVKSNWQTVLFGEIQSAWVSPISVSLANSYREELEIYIYYHHVMKES